jgi:hypothetical protein
MQDARSTNGSAALVRLCSLGVGTIINKDIVQHLVLNVMYILLKLPRREEFLTNLVKYRLLKDSLSYELNSAVSKSPNILGGSVRPIKKKRRSFSSC